MSEQMHLKSLIKGKWLILSSVLSIGCLTYVIHKWLDSRNRKFINDNKKAKKRNRKKSHDLMHIVQECSVRLSKTDVALLHEALDDLAISVHQIEILLKDLPNNDHCMAKTLERKILNLKNFLKHWRKNEDFNHEKLERKTKRVDGDNNDKDLQIARQKNEQLVNDYHDDDESEDSFVSASESQAIEPELSEISAEPNEETEDLFAKNGHLELYTQGIKVYATEGIPARKLRTKMLNCKNDADFKIKLFCLRTAFQDLFSQERWKSWFLQIGRKSLVDFLFQAGKDHEAFEREFDNITSYCQQKENWNEIEEELNGRLVCAMTFYDIVLDFIIMDAFEDLEEPPYALLAVIQNGWLTNSIKETALTTAVWSLLKAKTRMLQNQDAFMSRLYLVSQYLTPVLVWGFLGPSGKLKETCQVFKDAMLGFLVDIFSLEKANYSSSQTLADDIIKIARGRSNQGNQE